MERASEIIAAIFTAMVSMGAWTVKKMFNRIEKVEAQADRIERNLLTREDLQQIKETQNLILQHLLEHRKTEQEKNE